MEPEKSKWFAGPIGTPITQTARALAEAQRAEDQAVEEYESGLGDADNYGADDPGSTSPVPLAPWER